VVEALVRFVGCGVLKLVTRGRYASENNGILLEGCVGLFLLTSTFFFLHRLVPQVDLHT
jgi:hypothetical protein